MLRIGQRCKVERLRVGCRNKTTKVFVLEIEVSVVHPTVSELDTDGLSVNRNSLPIASRA